MLKTYHWPWKMAIQTHHRMCPQSPIHLPARLKKMQEDFESIFTALHAARKDLLSTQKELSGAKAVIAEQRGEISNLKRAIQTLENPDPL